MKTSREQLIEAITEAGGLHSIRVGSRLFIFDESSRSAVTKQATQYAIRSGETIYYPNGDCVLYQWVALENGLGSGSDRFFWHSDGNRVKHVLRKVSIEKGCKPVCSNCKEAFRPLEVV